MNTFPIVVQRRLGTMNATAFLLSTATERDVIERIATDDGLVRQRFFWSAPGMKVRPLSLMRTSAFPPNAPSILYFTV